MKEIAIHCAYDELKSIAEVVPNPRNPNTHPEKQVKLLAKIIEAHGWRAPITVSKRSGFVIRGHGRLAAAQLLGCETVPVDLQDYKNDAEEWADMIADNRIAELSEIDHDELMQLVVDLDSMDYDTGLLGYSDKSVAEMLAEYAKQDIKEDDFDVDSALDDIVATQSKLCDIYQLGQHRLMCGDSTSEVDVLKLMDGGLADMVFTDPPYNVDYQGGTDEKLKIQNDNMPTEEFNEFLLAVMKNLLKVTAPGGAIYVCHADSAGSDFRGAMTKAGWSLRQCLIWAKNQFTLGRQDYQWQHEPILYGWKPDAGHNFYGGRRQSTVIPSLFPVTVTEDVDGKKLVTFNFGIGQVVLKVPEYIVVDTEDAATVVHVEKPARNGEHPTMKPLALCAKFIANSSLEGQSVIDLFGGSGSTMMAAEQIGRKCYTMELDPRYCDVIIRRYEEMTGNKAVKVNK